MKKLYLLLILLLPSIANAQDALYETPNKKVELNGRGLVLADSAQVFSISGASAAELLRRAKLSVIHVIGFANVMEINNVKHNAFLARGTYSTDIRPASYHPVHPYISYAADFRVKDGRYRMEIKDMAYHMDFGGPGELLKNGCPQWFSLSRWRRLIREAAAQQAKILNELSAQMQNPQPLSYDF